MSRLIISWICVFAAIAAVVAFAGAPGERKTSPAGAAAYAHMAAMPLVFEQNIGQAKGDAQFVARGQGFTLGLNGSETLLSLRAPEDSAPPSPNTPASKNSLLRMRLAGANPKAKTTGEKRLKAKINYFIGDDPIAWKEDVPAFEAVRTRDVYPGIDLVHYGQASGALEYDLVVAPGVDPGQVRLAFEGADGISVSPNGDLVLETPSGEVRQHKPVCYQERAGKREPVAGDFVLEPTGVTVRLGAYDTRRPLVIDPVLSYSTYLGGGHGEAAWAIATDGTGRAYVTGHTSSTPFPTQGEFQDDPDSSAQHDVFVTVLDTTATGAASLLYSTYLGGNAEELGAGIAADATGRAFVTGYTASTNFPTQGALQSDQSILDAFVTVLDTNATGAASLLYSTYLGGDWTDRGRGIATDGSGRAYLVGSTSSTTFPVLGQYQNDPDAGNLNLDVFVTVLDTTATGLASLVYSTYLGGTAHDEGFGIAVDAAARVYVTGLTQSVNFPTEGEFQTDQPNQDAFVTALDTTATGGASLLYSCYLGGGDVDTGSGIATDGAGRAFVTGSTGSNDFPTLGEYQLYQTGQDGFVTVVDTTSTGGASLRYSTYLGGSDVDRCQAIAADGPARIYVTGLTGSADFPVLGQYQTYHTHGDAFVTVLDSSATGAASLSYSTYVGGTELDEGYGIATDGLGRVFVTGVTQSTNFPTVGQYQADQTDIDAFVSVLDFAPTVSTPVVPTGFTVEELSGTSLRLRWNDLNDAESGHEIQRRVAGGEFATVATLAANAGATATFDDTGLTNDTSYEYRVRALGDSPSEWSDPAAGTTGDAFEIDDTSAAAATATAGSPHGPHSFHRAGDRDTVRLELTEGDLVSIETVDLTGGADTFLTLYDTDGVSILKTDDDNGEAALASRIYFDVEQSGTYYAQVEEFNSAYGGGKGYRLLTRILPPDAPTAVTAVATGSTRVEVGWIDLALNEAGFVLERKCGTAAYEMRAILDASSGMGPVETFVDTEVLPDKVYTYRVLAFNDAGDSEFDDPGVAATLEAPTALTATGKDSATLSLTWTDRSAKEGGFQVERKAPDGEFEAVGSAPARSGSGATVTWSQTAAAGLAPETLYTFRVRAVLGENTSDFSNEAEGVVLAAPTGVNGRATGSELSLNWLDNSSFDDGYLVLRRAGSAPFVQVGTAPASAGTGSVSWQDQGLQANTAYQYRVVASRGASRSNAGSFSATTVSAPVNLAMELLGSTQIKLLWTDTSPLESGFKIERKAGGGEFAQIATRGSSPGVNGQVTWTDATLAAGETYVYRVRAFTTTTDSQYSASLNVAPLAAPSELVATVAGATSVRLDWRDNSHNEKGFKIERRTGNQSTWTQVAAVAASSGSGSSVSYTDSGLTPKVTYRYRVRAYSAAGFSSYSNTASASPR